MAGEIDLNYTVVTTTTVGQNGRVAQQSVNNTSGTIASAATQVLLGIIQQGAAVGDQMSVRIFGLAAAIAGGTIATGDRVTADANGAVVATTTGGDVIVGVAKRGGVAGELVEILVGQGLNIVRTS